MPFYSLKQKNNTFIGRQVTVLYMNNIGIYFEFIDDTRDIP